jgi:hypothetical protein
VSLAWIVLMQMAATWLSDTVPRIDKQYPALLGSSELRGVDRWNGVRDMKVSRTKSVLWHQKPSTSKSQYHGLLGRGEFQVYKNWHLWNWCDVKNKSQGWWSRVRGYSSCFVFRKSKIFFSAGRTMMKPHGLSGFTPRHLQNNFNSTTFVKYRPPFG